MSNNSFTNFKLATELPAWSKLQKIYESQGKTLSVKQEFQKDAKRFEKLNKTFTNYDGSKILFDYSKNLVNDEIIAALIELAKEANVTGLRDAMFKGEHINSTEDRSLPVFDKNQFLAVLALVIVSAVVKVLEAIKNKVVSGSTTFKVSAMWVPSMLETKWTSKTPA